MEDSGLVDGVLDGEQHLILAICHAVKALEVTQILSQDMRRNLAELGIELSKMIRLHDGEVEDNREIQDKLVSAWDMIMNLFLNNSRIWDSSLSIVIEYLKAVNEVRISAQSLESVAVNKSLRTKGILYQAQAIQQIAMVRLQEELVHILDQNKQRFQHYCMSVPVCEEDLAYEESIISNKESSVENASQRASCGSETLEYLMDEKSRAQTMFDSSYDHILDQNKLCFEHVSVPVCEEGFVYEESIISNKESSEENASQRASCGTETSEYLMDLKLIAKTMFDSGYDQEFCQTFVKFWRETMAEYLTVLNMEQLTVADVITMEWKCLSSRIWRWCRAMREIIGVYLPNTKLLFDQVLGEYGCASSICLVEASKAHVLCLMGFAEAVAIGPHSHRPERLYCFLDMYNVLVTLIPNVEVLYPQETGLIIKSEFLELLDRLGDSAKATYMGFGNFIASYSSAYHPANGGIHTLTRYILHYMISLVDYGDSLNSLLEDDNAAADHLRSFTSILEANLESNYSYQDLALKQIFLMNNMHYMVQKVRSSNLRTYLGDEWIREHICKYQEYAMCYQRTTWSSILPLLRDDGKRGKVVLKARSRAFDTAFQDLYRNQTGWRVPDQELREELRISASTTVIHAYRSFVRNISYTIGNQNVKYTDQDLETYIHDLLEGASKSYLRRR